MEEQTSWKGHTFTLMVFGGIVVLCSIFFVLGMLVGRTQGQKIAAVAAAEAAAKALPKDPVTDPRPELTFYSSVDKDKQAALEPAPAKPAPPPAPAPKREEPPSPPANVVIQVSALGRQTEAEKLVNELKKKRFRAFMLTPVPGDKTPLYRVQVGPFADPIEAESIRKKLQTAGYAVLVKP